MTTPTGETRRSWLDIKLRAGHSKSRAAADVILAKTGDAPDVVEALHDMIDETDRWKSAWAQVTVDKDHAVRDAVKRSESCEHHGGEIKELLAHLDRVGQDRDHAEAGRRALLAGMFKIEEFVGEYELLRKLKQPVPDDTQIVTALRKHLTGTHVAHKRAWSK
jgi:hypothetical protein